MGTEDKNNIPYDTEYNNSQLVYFKVVIGWTQKTYSSEKNETARNCWDEYRNFNIKLKKVFERKIEKEPIKYLEYPNQMNKIFYVRSKLWPPSCPIFWPMSPSSTQKTKVFWYFQGL